MFAAETAGEKAPSSKAFCLSLALMTLAVFWPVVTHDFVAYDDNFYTVELLRANGSLGLAALRSAFTTIHHANWLPLTLISHMLDLRLFGLHPSGHHLTSLLIHVANALLLFLIMRRMTADAWRSAFVAAVFAVHPLQVESVAWVSERKNVLSLFFFLLALWNYVAYARRPSRGRYALILLSFAAALMSKASAVVFPFLLPLLDRWPLRRLRLGRRRLIAEKIPLLALAAASSAAALFSAERFATRLPLSLRLGNALLSCMSYLRKAVWPAGLSVFYPYPAAIGFWKALGAAFVLGGGTLAAFRFRKERPYLLTGWAWFLIALAPMLGLVQVGAQAMADRYAYIPLIGLAVMAAWTLPLRSRRGRTLIPAGAVLIGALMAAAGVQVLCWRDTESLFEHAVQVDERDAFAQYGLGGALLSRGETGSALAHYRRALELAPNHADLHNDVGVILAGQGRFEEAVRHFAVAAHLAEDPQTARTAGRNLATAAAALAREKDRPRAAD